MASKLLAIEDTLRCLTESLNLNKEASISNSTGRSTPEWPSRESGPERNDGPRPVFGARLAHIDFSTYDGTDPTEWLNRVDQFFYFQETPEEHRVSLAAFHIGGEANQWRQRLKKTHKEEGRELGWTEFVDELWARFGPTECEDFDETFFRVKQIGPL